MVVCRLYLFAEVFTGIFPLPYFQSITALRKSWKIARKSFLISAIILFSFLGAHSPSLCKCKLTWELPGRALTLPHPSATVAVNEKVVNRNVCENSNFFFSSFGAVCVGVVGGSCSSSALHLTHSQSHHHLLAACPGQTPRAISQEECAHPLGCPGVIDLTHVVTFGGVKCLGQTAL